MKIRQLAGTVKVLFFAVLLALPVSFGFTLYYYIKRDYVNMFPGLASSVLEVIVLFFIKNKPDKLQVLRHIISIIVSIGPVSIMFNEIEKPEKLIWVVTYPLYLFITEGFRTGVIWNLCVYILFLFAYLIHPFYVQIPHIEPAILLDYFLANLFVLLVSGYFAFRVEKDSEEVADQTQKLNNILQQINQDLKFASRLQQNVILNQAKEVPGLDIAVAYQAYSHVSGDFYDITECQPGLIRIFIADVTGHGLQAALVTMTLKSEYDFLKNKNIAMNNLMEILNNSFCEKFQVSHIFATAFLIEIDLKNLSLEFTSAGHPAQLLYGSSGQNMIDKLSNSGKPLGITSGNTYKINRISIKPGMRLYLFTDGLTECHNEIFEEFGEDRLTKEILKTVSFDVKKQIAEIMNSAREFSHNQEVSDDVSCIIVEIKH
ncbi:MAG: serine/threonine-protein phosphatase [Spirochaetia bacterium]|nr:serine/threonine-protein phosphatase [Spirochaetia bacterium]